jgi:hypothetical protein
VWPTLAATAAIAALALIFTIVLWGDPPKAVQPVPVQSVPRPMKTADPGSTDNWFIHTLDLDHITPNEHDIAIKDARLVCDYASQGSSHDELVSTIWKGISGYTRENADKFLDDAIEIYCPENK